MGVSASSSQAALGTVDVPPEESLDRHEDLDDELILGGCGRIGQILLDEQILRLELLLVEVIRDGIVGRIHRIIGPAMDELERLAGRRLADRDLHVDLGTISYTSNNGNVVVLPFSTIVHDHRLTENIARIGVNYRIGWGGPAGP